MTARMDNYRMAWLSVIWLATVGMALEFTHEPKMCWVYGFMILVGASMLWRDRDRLEHESPCRSKISRQDPRATAARRALLDLLGEENFKSWFNALEFEEFDGRAVRASVPVKFLRNHIEQTYMSQLLEASQSAFPGAVGVVLHTRLFSNTTV